MIVLQYNIAHSIMSELFEFTGEVGFWLKLVSRVIDYG